MTLCHCLNTDGRDRQSYFARKYFSIFCAICELISLCPQAYWYKKTPRTLAYFAVLRVIIIIDHPRSSVLYNFCQTITVESLDSSYLRIRYSSMSITLHEYQPKLRRWRLGAR